MPDAKAIRILMIEDHALLRGALAKTLSAEPDMTVVSECAGVEEALLEISQKRVDIVLLDINLGSEQGGAFLTRSKAVGFRGRVLVVTAGVGDREAAWLLNRGCSGIFVKTEPLRNLVERIRQIARGEIVLDPVSVRAIVAQQEGQGLRRPLTARESRVLRLVCEGLANKEIAHELKVTENTVKSFLQQLFTKTGARSRAQLVAVAIEQYWDQLDQA